MGKKKQTDLTNLGPQLIVDDAPFEYVEAFKTFRTNFNFVAMNGKNRRIVVTSTLGNEGKSSTAINLAISLAQAGSRVLLVDTDMRKPSIHRYLRLKREKQTGLSALLTGNAKVGDCLHRTEHGFDVITGGATPPNPTELIASEAMDALLQNAAEHYDYVICDAPPVGVITDAAALSRLCDGVLFVIRQGYASRNQVAAAMNGLRTVGAKVLGIVLSQYFIPKRPRKRYGYYRNARYGYSYGYEYGYGYGYGYGNSRELE